MDNNNLNNQNSNGENNFVNPGFVNPGFVNPMGFDNQNNFNQPNFTDINTNNNDSVNNFNNGININDANNMNQSFDEVNNTANMNQAFNEVNNTANMNQAFNEVNNTANMNQAFNEVNNTTDMNQAFNEVNNTANMNQTFNEVNNTANMNQAFNEVNNTVNMNDSINAVNNASPIDNSFNAVNNASPMNNNEIPSNNNFINTNPGTNVFGNENQNNNYFNPNMNNSNINNNFVPQNGGNPVNMNQEPKKKSFLPFFIIISVLVIAILVFGGLFLFTDVFKTPKQKVMKAFSNTFGQESLVANLSNNKKINTKSISNEVKVLDNASNTIKKISEGKQSTTEFNLTLEDIELYTGADTSMLSGAGIETTTICDLENKEMQNDFSLRYNGLNLINLSMILLDSDFYITEGSLTGGKYITFNTETLKDDFSNSDLAALTKLDVNDPEISDLLDQLTKNYFDEMDNKIKPSSPIIDLSAEKSVVQLYKDIVVEKKGSYKNFTVGENEVKGHGYTVTLTQDALNNFFEALKPEIKKSLEDNADYFEQLANSPYSTSQKFTLDGKDYSIDEFDLFIEDAMNKYFVANRDYSFDCYINDKCELIGISYVDSFTVEDNTLDCTISIDFVGEKSPADTKKIYVELTPDDEEPLILNIYRDCQLDDGNYSDSTSFELFQEQNFGSMNLTGNFDMDIDTESGDFDLTFNFSEDSTEVEFDLNASGNLETESDYVSVSCDDISIDLYKDDSSVCSIGLSGDYKLSSEIEGVNSPSKDYDIFNMNQVELTGLLMEVYSNLQSSPLSTLAGDF